MSEVKLQHDLYCPAASAGRCDCSPIETIALCEKLVFPNASFGPTCVRPVRHVGGCAFLACANPGCASYDGHDGACASNESALAIELKLILKEWDTGRLSQIDLKTRIIAATKR